MCKKEKKKRQRTRGFIIRVGGAEATAKRAGERLLEDLRKEKKKGKKEERDT